MTADLGGTVSAKDQAATPAVRPVAKAQPDPRFARPKCLFFGIGAEKCGTSWLHSYFKGHPDAHVPLYTKELHYWSSVRHPRRTTGLFLLEKQMPHGSVISLMKSVLRPEGYFWRLRRHQHLQNWRKALTVQAGDHSRYADVLFKGHQDEKAVGEITPAYATNSQETFEEMSTLAPDVRFIFIMRDPVSRLWSGCRHTLRVHHLSRDATTTEAVADRLLAGLVDPEDGPVKRSCYDQTIKALESVVALKNIGYFFYETLFQQPEIDRLCDFLGIARRAANFDQMVHVGYDAAGEMPPDVARQAREALRPTYEFCKAKFGTLPPEWQDVTVRGDA
jgi:hypothetical protein